MTKRKWLEMPFNQHVDYLILTVDDIEYRLDVEWRRDEKKYPFRWFFRPVTFGKSSGPLKIEHIYGIKLEEVAGWIAGILSDKRNFEPSYRQIPGLDNENLVKYSEPRAKLRPIRG